MDLAVYGLNDVSSPKDVPFGVLMTTHNYKGFKPPKKPKMGVHDGYVFSCHTGNIIKSQYLRRQISDLNQIFMGQLISIVDFVGGPE